MALAGWRLPRGWSSRHLAAAVLWLLPIAAVGAIGTVRGWVVPVSAVFLGAAACATAALIAPRLVTWYRRATVASRILALYMAFLLPALLVYPSVHFFAERALRSNIATLYASEAMQHPQELQARLEEALHEIDALPGLADAVAAAVQAPVDAPPTETAFRIWSQTVLGRERLTSDLEIYDDKGALEGRRFALNFPEYAGDTQTPERLHSCEWEKVGEALLFGGSQERNTLHAQRSVCVGGTADRDAGRPRRLRLSDAPVHPLAVGVLRRVQHRELGQPARRPAGRGRRVHGLRLGAHRDLFVRARRLAARRRHVPTDLPFAVTRAVLDGPLQGRSAATRSTSPTIASSSTRSAIAIPGVFDHLVRLAELTTLAAAALRADPARLRRVYAAGARPAR